MESNITLRFDKATIDKAKRCAEINRISVSKLVEFLLNKITTSPLISLEEYPVADWIHELSEGDIVYQTNKKTRKELSKEYFLSKK